MAKELHNDVFDAALQKIATATKLSFCVNQPANYAAISGERIIEAALASGEFTIANGDVSGRKITVHAQTGMTPSANGTVGWAVLDDGSTLLAATSVTSQAVTTSQTWDSPAFDIELTDPT